MTVCKRRTGGKKEDYRTDMDNESSGPLVFVYQKDTEMTDFTSQAKRKGPNFLQGVGKWACNILLFLAAADLMLYFVDYLRHADISSPSSTGEQMVSQPSGQKWAEAVTNKCGHPRQNSFFVKKHVVTPGNCTLKWDENNLHGSIATGQNLEDAVIFSRFFTGSSPLAHLSRGNGNGESVGGIFLEMGALDGLTFSNSITLEYCAGWDGILIEANPRNVKKVFENRPCAVVIPEGVCGKRGGSIRMSKGEGTSFDLSTREGPATTAADEGVDVPCRPLSDMLEEYGVKRINFFSLDVNGAELKVLETFDFGKVKIDVLMVEADFMTDAQKNLGEEGKTENQKKVEAVRALVEKSGMKRVPSRLDGKNSDKRLCARNGKSGTGTYDCIFLSIAGSDVFVSPELYEYDTKPWEFGKQGGEVSDQ